MAGIIHNWFLAQRIGSVRESGSKLKYFTEHYKGEDAAALVERYKDDPQALVRIAGCVLPIYEKLAVDNAPDSFMKASRNMNRLVECLRGAVQAETANRVFYKYEHMGMRTHDPDGLMEIMDAANFLVQSVDRPALQAALAVKVGEFYDEATRRLQDMPKDRRGVWPSKKPDRFYDQLAVSVARLMAGHYPSTQEYEFSATPGEVSVLFRRTGKISSRNAGGNSVSTPHVDGIDPNPNAPSFRDALQATATALAPA